MKTRHVVLLILHGYFLLAALVAAAVFGILLVGSTTEEGPLSVGLGDFRAHRTGPDWVRFDEARLMESVEFAYGSDLFMPLVAADDPVVAAFEEQLGERRKEFGHAELDADGRRRFAELLARTPVLVRVDAARWRHGRYGFQRAAAPHLTGIIEEPDAELVRLMNENYGIDASRMVVLDFGAARADLLESLVGFIVTCALVVLIFWNGKRNRLGVPPAKLLWMAFPIAPEWFVRLLLLLGADPYRLDGRGRSALHLAAENGHASIARQLIALGFDLEAVDGFGNTPLCSANLDVHLLPSKRIVAVLVKAGANVEAAGMIGWRPLHHSVTNDRLTDARVLLAAGADIDARDEDGYSPLHFAALWARDAHVEEFLARGGILESVDRDGNTALHLAASQRHPSTVALLLERGASPDARNRRGDTPEDLASGLLACKNVLPGWADESPDSGERVLTLLRAASRSLAAV